MRKTLALIAAAGALGSASLAHAQSFGVWVGSGSQYGYGWRGDGDGTLRAVCSGERARGLEGRLRHEEREGEIDPDRVDRIHDAIDRLEDRSRDECREGDRRAIWSIAQRYDRIDSWIQREAHGGW